MLTGGRVYVSGTVHSVKPGADKRKVKNLYERIKVEQLRETLREVFSEYGNVVDVVAKKNLKAKGQAFVVFDDVESAKSAIEEVQGFELFDKAMALDFAKTQSDATVEREGSSEDLQAHKRRRLAEKGTVCDSGTRTHILTRI